jgi:hypothetical protein
LRERITFRRFCPPEIDSGDVALQPRIAVDEHDEDFVADVGQQIRAAVVAGERAGDARPHRTILISDAVEVHEPHLHPRSAVGIVEAGHLGEVTAGEQAGERDVEQIAGASHGCPRNALSALKSVS